MSLRKSLVTVRGIRAGTKALTVKKCCGIRGGRRGYRQDRIPLPAGTLEPARTMDHGKMARARLEVDGAGEVDRSESSPDAVYVAPGGAKLDEGAGTPETVWIDRNG